jgi:hypothetical protein
MNPDQRLDRSRWSAAQKEYVKAHEGKPVGEIRMGAGRYYSGLKWQLGKARPQYGEVCDRCGYPLCFYAEPRSWSMRSSADVWNLMKCANVECQQLFESCS